VRKAGAAQEAADVLTRNLEDSGIALSGPVSEACADKAVLGSILFFYPVSSLTMNVPLLPEVLRLRDDSPQDLLPLATEGVQRYVWEGRFGSMLIEVVDGVALVNGKRVDVMSSDARTAS
jgi:hypothetical protein